MLRGVGGGADRYASDVIAIDGKTSRRSKKGAQEAIHLVSAFAARQRLVLGQVKVSEKSNEIVAIPALLEMLTTEGAIVTIDAMGCQRDIAAKILAKKADYVLALKGNQGTLREDVELFATEQKASGFKDTTVSRHEPSTATMGASRPESIRRFMMSRGCKNATIGPDYKALSWLRACARSVIRSSARHASTSRR